MIPMIALKDKFRDAPLLLLETGAADLLGSAVIVVLVADNDEERSVVVDAGAPEPVVNVEALDVGVGRGETDGSPRSDRILCRSTACNTISQSPVLSFCSKR